MVRIARIRMSPAPAFVVGITPRFLVGEVVVFVVADRAEHAVQDRAMLGVDVLIHGVFSMREKAREMAGQGKKQSPAQWLG
jgi:hypothetical protein